MSVSVPFEAVEAQGFGGSGVVASALGRPERELAEAVQSLGVAEQVAAVTEQGQGLLVAGGGPQ